MESKYDYVVFDIETTGLHPDSDQICEIAAIGVKDGLPQGLFSTLVAIEGSMPEAAGRVNGITDDMLKGAPAIGDALDAFLDFIGEDAVLAGHNIASFDIPFVANAAAKSGRVFIYPYVIDTLEAARELWPDLPSRSMDSLRGILNWLGFSVEDETEEGIDFVFFEDSGTAAYRDDMGRAVFEACAPVIGAGSVLVFMENWDEAKAEDPRIWRYTFDGEKMHVQDGRFVFD